jgi:hypothetical protein
VWWRFGLVLVLLFAALTAVHVYEHGPGRNIVDIAPATVVRIEDVSKVEEGGYFGATPTPWLVAVDMGSGRVEIAEMPVMPRRGAIVCVVHAESPLRGTTFEVIGYVDALASNGKTCDRKRPDPQDQLR